MISRRGGGCSELVSQVKPKYSLNFKIKVDIIPTIIGEHLWGEEGFLGMCMSIHELLNMIDFFIFFFPLLVFWVFFERK